MSNNMIKGYSISYDTKTIKKLDFTKMEEKISADVKEIWHQQFPDEVYPGEDGFKAGLEAEEIEDVDGEKKIMTAEEIEEFKEQIRAEVTESIRNEVEVALRAEMEAKAEEIINIANGKAETIIAEAIEKGNSLGEAAKTGIISLASSSGYEDGMKRANEEKEAALAAIEKERKELREDYERQVSELEPAFVEILKEYVRKITGIAYNNHTEVIEYLIDSALNHFPRDNTFDVKLCKEDYDRLSPNIGEIIDRYKGSLSLNFVAVPDLKKGQIRLENGEKVVNCGLGVSTEGLIDALDMLKESDKS